MDQKGAMRTRSMQSQPAELRLFQLKSSASTTASAAATAITLVVPMEVHEGEAMRTARAGRTDL
jgi:hypothetical protein